MSNPLTNPIIKYHSDGSYTKHFYVEGLHHCENGPAEIDYDNEHRKIMETYYVDGKIHRLDGPAIIEYHLNGLIKNEQWVVDYSLHRLDGPAFIEYDKYGSTIGLAYYIDDILFDSKESYDKYLRHIILK